MYREIGAYTEDSRRNLRMPCWARGSISDEAREGNRGPSVYRIVRRHELQAAMLERSEDGLDCVVLTPGTKANADNAI